MVTSRASRVLSSAIRTHRSMFEAGLHEILALGRASAGARSVSDLSKADAFTQGNISTGIELLARWAWTNDPVELELFIGWVGLIANAQLDVPGVATFQSEVLERTWLVWADLVRDDVGAEGLCILEAGLREVSRSLRRATEHRVRALFIGDCLQCDIVAGLHGPCLRSGISLVTRTLAHRVPSSLRNEIRRLASEDVDLVFYSPFSHEFSSDYAYVIRPENVLMAGSRVDSFLNRASEEARATLELLVAQYECPIYVHNAGGTQQHNGGIMGLLKLLMSARLRRRARKRINQSVEAIVTAQRSENGAQIFLVDEEALVGRYGAWKLGKVRFNSGNLHPTLLASIFGREEYFEAIYTQAFLSTRKVIVCDLDNTLWDGVIGEGCVEHFHDRQRILKWLKNKGVLLAINSKNDPAKVQWSDGTLREEDFVCAHVNWNQKSLNIKRIRDTLNLKVKDFVFLDDRPDEREQVKSAFSEIQVMDPMDPLTWRLLEHWASVLPAQADEDRTKLYRERVSREGFLAQMADGSREPEDESAAFRRLELCIRIREPDKADLKRVVELINRTNQFNLCGSRTTLRELSSGLGSHRLIILAEAKDKFGPMGIVGILCVERKPTALEIPIFVLSCRVFGFGIEYALLNCVKRRVGCGVSIVGHYRETPHNEPCRKVYSLAGFHWDGGVWTGRNFEGVSDPAWLSIENLLLARPFWGSNGGECPCDGRENGLPAAS